VSFYRNIPGGRTNQLFAGAGFNIPFILNLLESAFDSNQLLIPEKLE
jgi:hypothetical protein